MNQRSRKVGGGSRPGGNEASAKIAYCGHDRQSGSTKVCVHDSRYECVSRANRIDEFDRKSGMGANFFTSRQETAIRPEGQGHDFAFREALEYELRGGLRVAWLTARG